MAQKPTPAGTVQPGYTTTEFWQTLLVNVAAIAVALGSVIKPGFKINGLQALVPAVALFAASISQSFYSHSRAMVKSAAQAAAAQMPGGVPSTGTANPPPIVVNVAGFGAETNGAETAADQPAP